MNLSFLTDMRTIAARFTGAELTKLGTIPQVDTKIVEKLFTADLAYLQDLYQRINQSEAPVYNTICPKCGQEVELPVNFFLQNE